MNTGRRTLAPHAVTAALLASFLGFGLHDLGRAPKIYEDESVIAAPGYTFVTSGVFGSPLTQGTFGSERHCYELMPLFSILVGASMRVFGFGLFQARLVPLAVATGVLLLTHLLATRLLSAFHGATAVAFLAFAPVASPVEHLPTGIPMIDIARLVRYDVPVGLFGLAALLTLAPVLRGDTPPGPARLFAAGLLAGAATLSHVYGGFWLGAILLAVGAARRFEAMRAAVLPCAAGFLLALLPWIVFVASGWSDFLDQTYHYTERFELSKPGFYLSNLHGELSRYGLVVKAATRRLAPWLFVGSAVAGLFVLGRRTHAGRDEGARALLATTGVIALLFALLVRSKNVLYLATLWPLFALVASCGLVAVWRSGRLGRGMVALGCLFVAGEGLVSLGRFVREARSTTPYADFAETLSRTIPAGARVMGMQHWWLGLASRFPAYVEVPLDQTLPRIMERPVSFDQAADSLEPDVFLVDPVLTAFFRTNAAPGAPFHALAAAVQDWLARRGTRIAALDDPTYGPVEIYVIAPTVRTAAAEGRISDTALATASSTETRVRHSRSPRAQVGCMQAPQERSSL
jgi:4-amino-4-deoxy-L-arabinose transferase-like glycosyltransferase